MDMILAFAERHPWHATGCLLLALLIVLTVSACISESLDRMYGDGLTARDNAEIPPAKVKGDARV